VLRKKKGDLRFFMLAFLLQNVTYDRAIVSNSIRRKDGWSDMGGLSGLLAIMFRVPATMLAVWLIAFAVTDPRGLATTAESYFARMDAAVRQGVWNSAPEEVRLSSWIGDLLQTAASERRR
jgi:hypothetical protein